MDKILQTQIEIERKKLMDLYGERGFTLHPDVLACSRKLDELILKFLIEEGHHKKRN